MAKVKIKNLDAVTKNIKKVFNKAKTSRKLLSDIGKFVVDRNKFFARRGESLTGGGKPEPLPNLKESSKRIRERIAREFPEVVDKTFFKPGRSNVTLTGQLLDSLEFDIKNDVIVISFKGRRRKIPIGKDQAKTNAAVYSNLVSLGFEFLGLDEKGEKRVKKLVLDELRRTIRKLF